MMRRRSSSGDALAPLDAGAQQRPPSSGDSPLPAALPGGAATAPAEARRGAERSAEHCPPHERLAQLARTAASVGMRLDEDAAHANTTPRPLRRLARRSLTLRARVESASPSASPSAAALARRDSFTLRAAAKRAQRQLLREHCAQRARERAERDAMAAEEQRSATAWSSPNAANLASQERTLRRRHAYARRLTQRIGVLRLIDDDAAEIHTRVAEWEAAVASPPRSH
jgi:hypothetical protein